MFAPNRETAMNLQNVDIERTACASGTTIKIEGLGKFTIGYYPSLLEGILQTLCVLTGEATRDSKKVLSKITLLQLDAAEKFVEVRIAL